jgi:hypothetical protein
MTTSGDFDGVIGPTIAESRPSWPVRPHPGPGAPNVVVILLDDTGFAHLGCYGSAISTPHIDKARRRRAAVHQLPRDAAVLPHARRAAHRPEPPRGRDAVAGELQHRVP